MWRAVQAAMALDKKGTSVSVVSLHTIKPLDEELICEVCRVVRAVMLKGADTADMAQPLLALAAILAVVAILAILRYRRTLD